MGQLSRTFTALAIDWFWPQTQQLAKANAIIAQQDMVISQLAGRATLADIRANGSELLITIYRGDAYMKLTLYNANCNVRQVRDFIGLDA